VKFCLHTKHERSASTDPSFVRSILVVISLYAHSTWLEYGVVTPAALVPRHAQPVLKSGGAWSKQILHSIVHLFFQKGKKKKAKGPLKIKVEMAALLNAHIPPDARARETSSRFFDRKRSFSIKATRRPVKKENDRVRSRNADETWSDRAATIDRSTV
jgi:hypothetical protein